jgi:hypothetical protein
MKRLIVIFCWLSLSANALAITPEELARLSEKGAAEKRQVDRQLKLNDLHYQLEADALENTGSSGSNTNNHASTNVVSTEQNTGSTTHNENATVNQHTTLPAEPPHANKYTQKQHRQDHPQNVRNAHRQDAVYQQKPAVATVSSLNPSSRNTVYSDAVEPDEKRHYGILRGTWIKAELRRNINNAEPGDVELYISQEVNGDKKSLPVDTQLFAAKAFNSATQRLDMLTTYAITPSGREFELKARIYDTLKVSGLMGIIDADESKIAERGTTQGLAALGSSVLGEVGGQNIIGRGLAKGGQSIISDSERASQLDTRQQITIFVAPQPILLRVEETF